MTMFNKFTTLTNLKFSYLLKITAFKSVRKYADEATFCIPPAEVHLFEKSKIPTEAKLTKQEALIIYENMQMVRRMEIECSNLYKSKLIFGFCHLYAGSEAVGCALKSSMQPKDDVITSYRCHAFAMMFLNEMGKDGVQGVVSELTGRVDGVVKGKGGSMHMYVPHQFFGGQGIVGGQVPLGLGLSFAHKYKEDGGVSLILYGDGAANQGQVYESFNMAQLFKLPAVFICENNQYGMGTAKERSSASTDYYLAGRVIPGVKTDGMDVINVREISKFVMEHCRSGNGPVIMQLETYRYFGHSMSDPGTSYRSREEVQEVRKNNDPINKYKNMLLDKELVTKEELAEIDKKAKKHCADAKKKAATGKFPDDKEVYNYIYKNCLEQPRKPIIAG